MLCNERDASRLAIRLIGCYPTAAMNDPETFISSVAAILTEYDLPLVEKACSPRGIPRQYPTFLPTVPQMIEWLDAKVETFRRQPAPKLIGSEWQSPGNNTGYRRDPGMPQPRHDAVKESDGPVARIGSAEWLAWKSYYERQKRWFSVKMIEHYASYGVHWPVETQWPPQGNEKELWEMSRREKRR